MHGAMPYDDLPSSHRAPYWRGPTWSSASFPLSFEGSRPKLHAGAKGERGALICLKAEIGVLSKLTVGGGRYADLEACGGR
jgi:hypothetical protein